MRLQPEHLVGESSAATAGSLTTSRMLARARTAAAKSLAGLVDHQVVEGAVEAQPAALPAGIERTLAFFGCGRKHRHLVARVVGPETGRHQAVACAQAAYSALMRRLVGRVQRRVAGRHRIVGGALEHGQRLGLLRDDRNRLDRRRAGADHADPLAGEVDPSCGHSPVW
jgi:hypothetical protein